MANFCPNCGRPLGGQPCPCTPQTDRFAVPVAPRSPGWLPALALTGLAVAAAVVVAVVLILHRSPGSTTSMFAADGLPGGSAEPLAQSPSAPPPATTTRSTTTTRPTTTTTRPQANPAAELVRYAAQNLPGLRADGEGRWVAQLSSKRPGMAADRVYYDHDMILADHLNLRGLYAGTRLVWTGDWTSFKHPDYWVTVAGARFDTADEANHWCDAQALPKDDCYAKRLSTTSGYEGNTKVR